MSNKQWINTLIEEIFCAFATNFYRQKLNKGIYKLYGNAFIFILHQRKFL